MTHASTTVIAAPRREAIDVLLNRIKAEYTELPGLQLTRWQAQRLLGLDDTVCDALLAALVAAAFLRQTKDGAFVRRAS